MLQTSPSFTRAAQNPQLAELKEIGQLYETFFHKNNIPMEACILERNQCAYPVLMLVPDEGAMDAMVECLAQVQDKICSHMRGVCLVDIAHKIDDSDRYPAGIVLIAHNSIVQDFGMQLCAMHETAPHPRPAVA